MIATEYHKIETLWNRDKETFSVIKGEFRIPEFGLVRPEAWIFQEKIDGTNIRVQWDGSDVEIGGKTNNAQLPGDLLANLIREFTPSKLGAQFADASVVAPVVLCGEGYGPGIQKNGGAYRADKGFILFDVRVGDWWLEWSNVQAVASGLGCSIVPTYENTIDGIVDGLMADAIYSVCAADPLRKAEGVVMRTEPTLYSSRGHRIMAKLKASDFKAGKR